MPEDTWWKHAQCEGEDTEQFFAVPNNKGQMPEKLQATCTSCPVRVECLRWAFEKGELGFWGGTTESQREAMRRPIRRAKCPVCLGTQIHNTPEVQTCMGCGTSWRATKKTAPGHPERRRRAAQQAASPSAQS